MCAAAHGWVGLGAIVFAVSAPQLSDWRASYDEMTFALHREAADRRG
jgi:tRNA(Arg) A34 adenosine deaminase TadA